MIGAGHTAARGLNVRCSSMIPLILWIGKCVRKIRGFCMNMITFFFVSLYFAQCLSHIFRCRPTIQWTLCPRFGRVAFQHAPSKALYTKPARAESLNLEKGTVKLGTLICTIASTNVWHPRFSLLPREDKDSVTISSHSCVKIFQD